MWSFKSIFSSLEVLYDLFIVWRNSFLECWWSLSFMCFVDDVFHLHLRPSYRRVSSCWSIFYESPGCILEKTGLHYQYNLCWMNYFYTLKVSSNAKAPVKLMIFASLVSNSYSNFLVSCMLQIRPNFQFLSILLTKRVFGCQTKGSSLVTRWRL